MGVTVLGVVVVVVFVGKGLKDTVAVGIQGYISNYKLDMYYSMS